MDNQKITGLLKGWSQKLGDAVRPGLAWEIKRRIPDRLAPHRIGTINIVVDLRASRIAVAAAIVIGVVLLSAIVGRQGGISQAYQDSKLFVKYALVGEIAYRGEDLRNLMALRDDLVSQGRDVIYYGSRPGSRGKLSILMQWRIDDPNDPNDTKYGVVLSDLSPHTVTASTLVRLQAQMLQDRAK